MVRCDFLRGPKALYAHRTRPAGKAAEVPISLETLLSTMLSVTDQCSTCSVISYLISAPTPDTAVIAKGARKTISSRNLPDISYVIKNCWHWIAPCTRIDEESTCFKIAAVGVLYQGAASQLTPPVLPPTQDPTIRSKCPIVSVVPMEVRLNYSRQLVQGLEASKRRIQTSQSPISKQQTSLTHK
jgi:hypothetical protein